MNTELCIKNLREHLVGREAPFEQRIFFRVGDRAIKYLADLSEMSPCPAAESTVRDVVLDFPSWLDAYEILTGEQDFMTAFMEQKIRTNGYIAIVYLVLSMFQVQREASIPE